LHVTSRRIAIFGAFKAAISTKSELHDKISFAEQWGSEIFQDHKLIRKSEEEP